MYKEFIKLMECFTTEKLSGEIVKNQEIDNEVALLEKIFNPNNVAKQKLKSNKICPIATSGDKFKYVVIGLNPHDDGEVEELNSIKTWEEIAKYHTPANLNVNNTFSRVMTGEVSTYYKNLTILFESLEKGELVEWSKDFKGNLDENEVKEKFFELIEKNPIAVAEMVPFASEKFGTISKSKLNKLLQSESKFKNYIINLLDLIKNRTLENGWIICNGKNPCDAFKMALKITNSEQNLKLIANREEKKYSLYQLGDIKVLLLHNSIRNIGDLNTYEAIGNMIKDVTTI